MASIEFVVASTTGDIVIICQQLVMFRCPLCTALFTENVIKEHLELHHRLEVK